MHTINILPHHNVKEMKSITNKMVYTRDTDFDLFVVSSYFSPALAH